jgi:proteasome lid subunit RPN8/RPN11
MTGRVTDRVAFVARTRPPCVITLSREVYDDVVYEAYDGDEQEVCGVLAGTHSESETSVEAAHPAQNVADNPKIRYYIDPEEQLEIVEAIEGEGLDVAGFYHSHPAGPTGPSETDAARATWPGLSYVIVALDGYPYAGSWRFRDDGFEQEVLAVDGSGDY